MSIVNMFGNLEKAKQTREKTMEIKSNLNEMTDRVKGLVLLVEQLQLEQKEARDKMNGKVDLFMIEALAGEVETKKTLLAELKELVVTKQEFADNLQEVSNAFEQFILNATPRGKVDTDTLEARFEALGAELEDLRNRNVELEQKLEGLQSTPMDPKPKPEVPPLPQPEIKNVVFKAPVKRTVAKSA